MNYFALENVHSIEFINSLCVVRKNPKKQNILGDRIVAGEVEEIFSGHRGKILATPSQPKFPWSSISHLSGLELADSIKQIAKLQHTIEGLENSWSWRVTAPFRWIRGILKKLKKNKKKYG